MLFIYSMGIAIPLYIAGISISKASRSFDYIKKHYKIINIISGVLLIAMGLFMVYQGTVGIAMRFKG
ncbi:MAG: hypothetical protein HG467_001700 [Clostridiales bacterium]|nr:hypothetical protein [Clostridiales bacterium]